jgi:two-component system sensor histidine kinase BaeS
MADGGPWNRRPPRHRPPWWPANEPWPPRDAAGRPVWRGRHRATWPAIGCLIAAIALVALLTAAYTAWRLIGAIIDPLLVPTRPFAFLSFLVIAIAVVALLRGFRRLAEPLTELVDAARRVEGGEYEVRVAEPQRGPRELRELTRAFNTMVSRLEADRRQRRSLLADVSHELRTPLAVLRGNLEALADGIHPADEEHLSGLIEETRVLERLVEDLRTISLAETGALSLHREPTDPDVLLGETVASFRAQAVAHGITLSIAAPNDLPLLDVDPVRIREVLANLIANALRATPDGGSITASGSAAADGRAVILTISDTGSGIDPSLLPHIFDRFARGPGSSGSGLGLAIARDLVLAHGGTIDVTSRPGAGTTFTIRLPIEPAAI